MGTSPSLGWERAQEYRPRSDTWNQHIAGTEQTLSRLAEELVFAGQLAVAVAADDVAGKSSFRKCRRIEEP